jgi:hypothetical protein
MVAHYKNIDHVKEWFMEQGERTQWKLWSNDRVPTKEEGSNSLIMYQNDSGVSLSQSFERLESALNKFKDSGGWFCIKVYSTTNDGRGASIVLKLEPQNGAYSQILNNQQQQPQAIGNVTTGNSERYFERLLEQGQKHSDERTALQLKNLSQENEIARLKDKLSDERKQKQQGIGNVVNNPQFLKLIETGIGAWQGRPALAGVEQRGVYRGTTHKNATAEDNDYDDQDDNDDIDDTNIIEIQPPDLNKFMAQANALVQYGVQANDALDLVYGISQIANKEGFEPTVIFNSLFQKLKANPSLLSMIC